MTSVVLSRKSRSFDCARCACFAQDDNTMRIFIVARLPGAYSLFGGTIFGTVHGCDSGLLVL
jgi:hypothetical protein